ncbi:MAG: 3'-5' exonuclease [Deltaproteobacteria bacterium]|nr:3'-5' exonuclease [Deltaproteobacteria bacterium]
MSSMKYLVYDIESVTDKKLLQRVLYPELEDPEAAYQQHLTELAEENREFVNPAFHQPISIAVMGLNEDFEILKIGLLGKEQRSPEAIVRHFWEMYNQAGPTLIDFNGRGFDIRLLELWAFRLGISIDPSFFTKFGPRYRFDESSHLDLHDFLTNYGAIRYRGGLDLFAKLIDKPGKMDTKGHMVQELYDQENFFQIDDYCLGDTMDTYFVFLRSLVMRGLIDLERENVLTEAAIQSMENKEEEEGFFKEYLKRMKLVSQPDDGR